MFLKKAILVGSLAFIGLPMTASALVTNNLADKDSTVKITTATAKVCSNRFPGGITKAGERNHNVPKAMINLLCSGSPANKCGADIFMSSDCSGNAISHAILDMNSGNIDSIQDRADPHYKAVKTGAQEVTMSKR